MVVREFAQLRALQVRLLQSERGVVFRERPERRSDPVELRHVPFPARVGHLAERRADHLVHRGPLEEVALDEPHERAREERRELRRVRVGDLRVRDFVRDVRVRVSGMVVVSGIRRARARGDRSVLPENSLASSNANESFSMSPSLTVSGRLYTSTEAMMELSANMRSSYASLIPVASKPSVST